MTNTTFSRRKASVLMIAIGVLVSGCDRAPAGSVQANTSASAGYKPVTVTHALGTTIVQRRPERVAALDMNELDFLDQLGVPVAGIPKDHVPHFLARYRNDAKITDIGMIVQPNLEKVHALHPDLILITPLQAPQYKELNEIASTIHYDIDFKNSGASHIDIVKAHLLTLGGIFGKEEQAREKIAALDAKINAARAATQASPARALIVMHNKGSFASFGTRSRYGFVFDALGVKAASTAADIGLHGQPVSSEFIQAANPDIIYVIDRTAVMDGGAPMTAETMGNPLIRETKAWKNGHVIFVDSDAWYTTAASPASLGFIVDDVLKGYRR